MNRKTAVPKLRFPEFRKDGGWEIKALKDISPSIFDGTHQTPRYTENGVPFFSVENLISKNKNKYISKQDHDIATIKNKPEKDDILITRIGNIGFSKVIDWDSEFSIYVTLAVIKKSDSFISHYLNSYLESTVGQSEMMSRSLLNAVPCKINMNELRQVRVAIPVLKEQKEIAECLRALDELITAQCEKVENLKKYKKGFLQQLFPQEGESIPRLRFPEFEISGDWECKSMGEVFTYHTTNSLSRDKLNYEDGIVKNIHYGDIHKKFNTLFRIENEKVPYINLSESLSKIKSDSYCRESDLILADASEDLEDIGKSIEIVNLNEEKVLAGTHTILARSLKDIFVIGFKGYLFKSDYVRNQIKSEAQGAKVLGISSKKISKLKLCFPKSKYEQLKIVNFLSMIDNLIKAESDKSEQLKVHKKGLLQQLFPSLDETTND